MEEHLLDSPKGFDEEDCKLFAVQLRNLRKVKEQEHALVPPKSWLTTIAQYLYPVGADAFEKSLIKLKDRVRENDRILEAWQKKCISYDNKPFEEVRKNLEWLPWTVFDVYVIDIVARLMCMPMVHWTSDHVNGPAVRAAFKANMCLWVFYSVFPFLRYFTYHFDWWECQPNTFANCRMFVLALYLPVVLFAMYCEYVAMIYALPPQVAMIGPLEPKVFRRFTAWFLFAYSVSLVAHMDLATNSLFLAKVLATERCGFMTSIEHAWEDVFSKSVFRFLANHVPTFASVVIVLWFFLFGQFWYALALSVPTATGIDEPMNLSGLKALMGLDDGAFYEVKDLDQETVFRFKTYRTLMYARTQHGTALHALAESGRMYTLQCNTWSVQQKTLNLHKSGPLFRLVLKTVYRFVLFMWFESILQLELQGSALELGKAVSPRHEVDKETVASLFLSLIMASYNFLTLCGKFRSQVRACLDADVHERDEERMWYNQRVKKSYCNIVISIFVILAICFALLVLHALVKTVMVSFYCDCGWNLRLNPFDGCVPPQSGTGTCFVA